MRIARSEFPPNTERVLVWLRITCYFYSAFSSYSQCSSTYFFTTLPLPLPFPTFRNSMPVPVITETDHHEKVPLPSFYRGAKALVKRHFSQKQNIHAVYHLMTDQMYHQLRYQQTTVFRLRTGRYRLRFHLHCLGLTYIPGCKCETAPKTPVLCLLVSCLTSQQHSVSQGRICSVNFTWCHTEIEVADQTFHLTQSQYTDTGPTSHRADSITPGRVATGVPIFKSTPKKSPRKRDSKPGSSALEADALTLTPEQNLQSCSCIEESGTFLAPRNCYAGEAMEIPETARNISVHRLNQYQSLTFPWNAEEEKFPWSINQSSAPTVLCVRLAFVRAFKISD